MNTDPNTEHIDPINADLAEVMNNIGRFSTNPEIRNACYQLLTAASQILILRHQETLTKDDLRYVNAALDWSDRGRNTLADLAVALHEGKG